MNLFFSGGPVAQIELDERLPRGLRYRLLSCHGAYVSQAHKTLAGCVSAQQPFEMMLDSGAFTAWSQGKEVDLNHLIGIYDLMLEKYGGAAEEVWLISLDKIPGSRGRTATTEELEEACRISDENFAVLQKRYGDRVLPVFHQNETSARLHEIAAMAPYICVSPRNDLHEASRRAWSMEVHSLIPGKRTHGLAATGFSMMRLVPWTSVDSATWVLLAANGQVFRDMSLRTIKISDEAGTLKDRDEHFRTLPKPQRDHVAKMFEPRGFTLEQLETDFYHRMIYNRVIMTEAYRAMAPPAEIAQAVPTQTSLFDL